MRQLLLQLTLLLDYSFSHTRLEQIQTCVDSSPLQQLRRWHTSGTLRSSTVSHQHFCNSTCHSSSFLLFETFLHDLHGTFGQPICGGMKWSRGDMLDAVFWQKRFELLAYKTRAVICYKDLWYPKLTEQRARQFNHFRWHRRIGGVRFDPLGVRVDDD